MVSWILFLEDEGSSSNDAAQVQELLAGDAWHLSSSSPRPSPRTPMVAEIQTPTSRIFRGLDLSGAAQQV